MTPQQVNHDNYNHHDDNEAANLISKKKKQEKRNKQSCKNEKNNEKNKKKNSRKKNNNTSRNSVLNFQKHRMPLPPLEGRQRKQTLLTLHSGSHSIGLVKRS